MGHLNQKWDKIYEAFFNYPNKDFHLRELARFSNIPKTTLQRYLNALIKNNIIKKNKINLFYTYRANEMGLFYKLQKRNNLIEKLYRSGLIDYLEKQALPKVIILFGSGAKGEYILESDIDLFLLTQHIDLNLNVYEKKLR